MLRLFNSSLLRYRFSQNIHKALVVGVPKENTSNEKRVALTPEGVARLKKSGLQVIVEKDSGIDAGVTNDKYIEAGAQVVSNAEVLNSDVLLKVKEPTEAEIDALRSGSTVISLLFPARNKALI